MKTFGDLLVEIELLGAENERLQDRLFTLGAMHRPPCFVCGYNGQNYYSPSVHPCAERHHALTSAGNKTVHPSNPLHAEISELREFKRFATSKIQLLRQEIERLRDENGARKTNNIKLEVDADELAALNERFHSEKT